MDTTVDVYENKNNQLSCDDMKTKLLQQTEKKPKEGNLSSGELKIYRKIIDIIPSESIELGDSASCKKTYRTRAKLDGNVCEIPEHIVVITNKTYRYALSLKENDGAYLLPMTSAEGLEYREETGEVLYKNFPVSEETLKDIQRNESTRIGEIDIPLIRMFYSMLLSDFEKNLEQEYEENKVFTIYLPDFAEKIGKKRTISKNDINSIVEKTVSFQKIYGILKDTDRNTETILPLLIWKGYDENTNTIRFSSPYMQKLIRRIYEVSMRKDKSGTICRKKDGTPLLKAAYSYSLKSSIVKERNKKAVEIVAHIVATIELAGDREHRVPHMMTRTILENIPQLQEAYSNAAPGNKNNILSRAFKKAWELLETQTTLRNKYPDINLPDSEDPANIPTSKQLGLVFEFRHGLSKNK